MSQGEGGQHLPDFLDLVLTRAFSIGHESQGILYILIIKKKLFIRYKKYSILKYFLTQNSFILKIV
jgi:hypothetical protein